jgi:glycosyltransferase involved in cell wall biosynthesis
MTLPLSVPCSSVTSKLDLTVLILTFNEAMHIERAIASVRDFASDVVIIDSYSTDGTVEIARRAGARVLQNTFIDHSAQFQWGINNSAAKTTWLMRLDADEVIEPDLAEAIIAELPGLDSDVVGINLDRKHIFMGKWIKHGGRYPVRLMRIWRRGFGQVERRSMDEHILVWGGRTILLKGGFSDINLQSISFFIEKHNKYATREAIERLGHRHGFLSNDDTMRSAIVTKQTSRKRFFKDRFYNHLPLGSGPTLYFLYRYFIQLGFLDGKLGFIYHFLQGYWYRLLVDAKVTELENVIIHCGTKRECVEALSAYTGLTILSDLDHTNLTFP